jgi:shikimate kinase
MMGSGKTTVGRLLASRTEWPFYDNDVLLAALHEDATPRSMLAEGGVDELRTAEAEALRLGLSRPAPSVVAAPAGAILDSSIRAALAQRGLVIWLDAGPRTLAHRARGAAHRPWLDTDAETWMRTALTERAALYKSVADLIVGTQRRRPAAIVNQILDWVVDRVECAVISPAVR